MPDATTKPADKKPATPKASEESIKETFDAIIVAFILAFVFRAYVVEAFVIPTGSMAPTLLGEHFDVTCEQCGFRFGVDSNQQITTREVICAMCNYPNLLPVTTNRAGLSKLAGVAAGDRILVHKYIYTFIEPARWDVVVFKNPSEPGTNFIKRLVGLPNEEIFIIDGNVFVRKNGETPWQIARKTDRPKVQRDVWQPIYHSSYVPLDGGTRSTARANHPWVAPWEPDDSPSWQIGASRSYRHDSANKGTIRFNFARSAAREIGYYPYNYRRDTGSSDSVEDVRVAAAFQPDAPGLAVTLRTTARLDSSAADSPKAYSLEGRIDGQGNATIEAQDSATGAMRTVASGKAAPFAPGAPRTIELWYVDQQASLWDDGKQILVHNFDLLSIDAAKDRAAAPLVPKVSISVSGSPVTLHRVELDRDIYYTSGEIKDGKFAGHPGWGVYVKSHYKHRGSPLKLEEDSFFCMGDNSPLSHDSRFWGRVDPWVEKNMFEGKAQHLGVVPRKLMMGRAFFVYFPAPYALTDSSPRVFPNFGDMRFIH